MKAFLRQIKGCSFVCKSDSNHWITIDTSKENFGSGASSSPMELILFSLGACSGCDVASILDKKKVELKDFEINIDSERSESYPKVFTKIHLEYTFYGKDIKTEHVERAILLSKEKYCPVYAMLKNSVTITSSYKIINE